MLDIHVKIARCLCPADVRSGAHDDVRPYQLILPRSHTLLSPSLLHRQHREHDGLGAANGADPSNFYVGLPRQVVHASEDVETVLLDPRCSRVRPGVDQVLCQALFNQTRRFGFHPRGGESCEVESGIGVAGELLTQQVVGNSYRP